MLLGCVKTCFMFPQVLYFISIIFSYPDYKGPDVKYLKNTKDTIVEISYDRTCALLDKSIEAFEYCRKNKMDTNFCLLQDMKIHSGKYRFFVWDFKKNKIIDSAMVSHGCGTNTWSKTYSKECPEFSNEDGSQCSSLGKYKIGKRNYSQWGIHINYTLYGLDNTNSNALLRTVVLHSWDDVPEQEVYPEGTPEGHGCPAVSNSFMKRLDKKLQVEKQPVLLWLYSEE